MTTEISDAARELYGWLDGHPYYPRWELVKRIEHTLTAARQQALEDAAKMFDSEHNAGQTIARTIRAMKVKK